MVRLIVEQVYTVQYCTSYKIWKSSTRTSSKRSVILGDEPDERKDSRRSRSATAVLVQYSPNRKVRAEGIGTVGAEHR